MYKQNQSLGIVMQKCNQYFYMSKHSLKTLVPTFLEPFVKVENLCLLARGIASCAHLVSMQIVHTLISTTSKDMACVTAVRSAYLTISLLRLALLYDAAKDALLSTHRLHTVAVAQVKQNA